MRVISQKIEIKSFTHKIKARVTFYFPQSKIKGKGKRHTCQSTGFEKNSAD